MHGQPTAPTSPHVGLRHWLCASSSPLVTTASHRGRTVEFCKPSTTAAAQPVKTIRLTALHEESVERTPKPDRHLQCGWLRALGLNLAADMRGRLVGGRARSASALRHPVEGSFDEERFTIRGLTRESIRRRSVTQGRSQNDEGT